MSVVEFVDVSAGNMFEDMIKTQQEHQRFGEDWLTEDCNTNTLHTLQGIIEVYNISC